MYFENGTIAVIFCKEYTLYCFIKLNGEIRSTRESINKKDSLMLRQIEDLEAQMESDQDIPLEVLESVQDL